MALGFGRKKPAPEAQDAPVPNTVQPSAPPASAAAPSATPETEDDLNNFDLDAFATELESGTSTVQKSPFDEMFTAPAAATPTETGGSGSAYDFPDLEAPRAAAPASVGKPAPLDLNAVFAEEQRDAIATGKIPPPNIPLSTNLAEVASEPNGLFEPQAAPKKKLPLVPILGALVALGLAGGAASYFTQGGSQDEEITAPPPIRRRPEAAPPRPATAPAKPAAPAVPVKSAAPAAPVKAAKPAPATSTTAKTGTAATVAKTTTGTKAATTTASAASAPLTPALQSQLKALWKKGAAAKHRGDFAGARAAWESALKLRPGHPGFAESIAKLPK
jgi:hypothetical protein